MSLLVFITVLVVVLFLGDEFYSRSDDGMDRVVVLITVIVVVVVVVGEGGYSGSDEGMDRVGAATDDRAA